MLIFVIRPMYKYTVTRGRASLTKALLSGHWLVEVLKYKQNTPPSQNFNLWRRA